LNHVRNHLKRKQSDYVNKKQTKTANWFRYFYRLDYYKNYFINVSPSTFDISTDSKTIIISGINNPYPKNFNDVEDTMQVPSLRENIESNNYDPN
jgi:hypothetical protein